MDRIREAYRIVLNDILNKDCKLFVGEYDAKNGSVEFMNGIATVMEYLAYNICDEEGDAFSEMFAENIVASEEKAHRAKCYKCSKLKECWIDAHEGKKM